MIKMSCMEIERKKNQMKPSTNKKCVSTSCHKNIAQWLAQKTNPHLLFFFFFWMHNQCIRKAGKRIHHIRFNFQPSKSLSLLSLCELQNYWRWCDWFHEVINCVPDFKLQRASGILWVGAAVKIRDKLIIFCIRNCQ